MQPAINQQERCEICHRKVQSRRLSISYLWRDAMSNLFNLEHGLIFTLWELIKNPGKVCNEFINGDRYAYMNPFRLLLTMATLATILAAITADSTFSMVKFNADDAETDAQIKEWIVNYLNIIILVSIPFYAFGSWAGFKKFKYNFAEHLVINAYGYSIVLAIDTVVTSVLLVFPDQVSAFWTGASQLLYLYMGYVYSRVFKIGWGPSILRYILASVVMILTLGIATTLIIFIAVMIKKA